MLWGDRQIWRVICRFVRGAKLNRKAFRGRKTVHQKSASAILIRSYVVNQFAGRKYVAKI